MTTPGARAAEEWTRTEAMVGAHECHWTFEDGDRGRCGCGLIVLSVDQWARHADQVVVTELWSPTAEIVNSVSVLEALPERSAVIVRPGRDGRVFRRIVLGDPAMSAWCDFNGTFRATSAMLPALVLERGRVTGTPDDAP